MPPRAAIYARSSLINSRRARFAALGQSAGGMVDKNAAHMIGEVIAHGVGLRFQAVPQCRV
jgi:hypothetical protein